MHPRARTTPVVRAEILARVLAGEPVVAVARSFGVSRQTVHKWVKRGRSSDPSALLDRSSRPAKCPHRTSPHLEAHVIALRSQRRLFAWQIAHGMGMARSTVIAILRRAKLHRLTLLEIPPAYQRYEYAKAGELVHIDIKKLARIQRVGHRIHGDRSARVEGVGWEHVYVCVDDATRLTFTQVRPREHRHEAAAFLRDAVRWFAARGIKLQRVMTDNGKVFLSNDFQNELILIKARHLRTPPYTPRINGKAERFIRTMLNECAYGVVFETSEQRKLGLHAWNRFYNEERPHSALNYETPAFRLSQRQ